MMHCQSLNVSLQTLQATSSLFGHELEDRSCIRDAQNVELFRQIQQATSKRLRGESQRELFCVSPLDILASDHQGRKQFHLLELNGTGIGGVTNMPTEAVDAMFESLSVCSEAFARPGQLLLLAVSGKEDATCPRMNRLMHEKLLFIDAMRRGVARRFGACKVATVGQLTSNENAELSTVPTVVVGYIKDLLEAVECDEDGLLWLGGRRVSGAVNDRFCRNLLQRFGDRVDMNQFDTLNRCFVPGSDKGVAYSLMNQFVRMHHQPALPDHVLFAHAHNRAELIDKVLQWVELGRRVVIKPHGTGLGHGIEFFLDPQETVEEMVGRIDASLTQTEAYYGIPGGALPYTICEYVDACTVVEPGHRLEGHKYELRVVVYRDEDHLRAMPSIAKVARERSNVGQFDRRAVINNITASGDTRKVCGTDFMLPLCNRRTLEALGLTEANLFELCRFATGFVAHTLNQLEDAPQRFGLPAAEMEFETVVEHAA